MATMIKEKRREKKKSKEKHVSRSSVEREQPSISNQSEATLEPQSQCKTVENIIETPFANTQESVKHTEESVASDICAIESQSGISSIANQDLASSTDVSLDKKEVSIDNNELTRSHINSSTQALENIKVTEAKQIPRNESLLTSNIRDTYQNLNLRLERISIPSQNTNLSLEEIQNRLENPIAYLKLDEEAKKKMELQKNAQVVDAQESMEVTTPSAPVFEEQDTGQTEEHHQREETIKEVTLKLKCMPLEEALRLYGGKEMAEVRAMSEKEEAIVEAGPVSGPEHPLVDLLSTFRTSLIAVERERTQLAKGFADEAKFRNSVWKVEKRNITISEDCPCGAVVIVRATYEHAELLRERLPVAKLRLEGLLRDVQESYCHHQHAALLAHCQIEELISETIQSNKPEIREALALVLQALRLSDNAPAALATALQRWAAILSSALLDARDLRQLLFLLHHLFRQTRSVQWAARVVAVPSGDRSSAARAIALLDLLLARTRLEAAVECTEDEDEGWEEMDAHGGGAVSEGALRERDLLALLRAFPLRDLLARIVLFTHSDISTARDYEWGDTSGGRGVLKACCGVRVLLAALRRAVTSHPHYPRLRATLADLAATALHTLADLHAHTRHSYFRELELTIAAELEAAFTAGADMLGPERLHSLPATLLREETAQDYCLAIITALHDNAPKPVECLSLQLPESTCEARVVVVTQAAVDRATDHQLARTVLDFLLQTGLKRKPVQCKGSCDSAAREQLPRLLAAHPYLHTIAFHTLADLNQAEPLAPSSVQALSAASWRPTPGEIRAVLDDWAQRCPILIQHLLMLLDYTPHRGLSLETQLTVGSWLCGWSRQAPASEWWWRLLRRLRLHRTHWGVPLDAPPPDPEPTDLFSTAYALLASSWGHCIPLICSEGVSALCELAAARAADAIHCLGPIMLVMAQSPVSVSLTPRFSELFSILLKSGPTMVQRALGLGPEPGSDMLLRLLLTHMETNQAGIPRSSILSAWLHALWRAPSGAALLDLASLAVRDWTLLDSHAAGLLQDTKASEHVTNAVRNVASAPLICECVLRNAHGVEARTSLCARVLDVLHLQRVAGDRIHVDNALKQIGANMPADDLVIYRCATALLSAPAQHPSHLMLWRLFFHLYLQRPPNSMLESTPPVGPLFFSGLVKSRLLAQLRKKLQDTVTYHHNEVETLKQNQKEEPKPPPRSKKDKPTPPPDDNVVPMLTITDLTGESSESGSDSSGEESEKENDSSRSDALEEKRDAAHLLRYHTAAENMCREFLQWLDKGDKVRAMPHHADVARFIPEQALAAAWSRELSRRRPAAGEELPPPSPPATLTEPQTTPFQRAVARLLQIKDHSVKRSIVDRIKSPLEGVDWRDARSVLSQAETHLAVIDTLQTEWSSEVNQISTLDAALWQYVTTLRVRRPLPPVIKRCPNKCKPLTIHIPHQEWCISTGAESGIQDNRRAARALVRRLARPRPHAARSAAALAALARRVGSLETARRVAAAAWRCAGNMAAACAPAHLALTALVDDLAQRWLCNDSKLCAELVTRWSANSNSLQQRLCGSLASPTRLPAPVYCALLTADLPSHNAFSYLSKFEMSRWSESIDLAQRHELLEALVTAAQRWGPRPDAEHHVLLELIGVHTALLLTPRELPACVPRCARASASCALPPAYWTHVVRAAEAHAKLLTFDQLGNLLRELGVIWWEARSGLKTSKVAYFAEYSTHIAALLHTLQRAFVAAAVALSYAPERVSLYAWSALQESWSAWIRPHSGAAPLLPSTEEDEAYTAMLRHFVDNVHQVMLDCPGTEEHLLQQIFDWTVQTYLSVNKASSQECGVQLSALLVELRALTWNEHQWVRPACLHSALQICACNDREMQWWCAECWRCVEAESWLRGAPDEQLAPLLASILYLLTAMPLHHQTLEQAKRLPWWRLPEAALEEAFERFFAQYHDPAHPYHELQQFRVLLSASELHAPCAPPTASSALSRNKRGAAVSRWVRAATAPALIDHVAGHSENLLKVIADVAPYLAGSDEVEELLTRASVIMCMEPAATAAMPVWQRVVSSWPPHLSGACVTAAGHLTAFEYFACLADTAVRALVAHKEGGGWDEVCFRWKSCHWNGASSLVARGRLHAAYGVARAHPQTYSEMRTALLALLATNINFVENEAIVALWICASCRIARECGTASSAGAAGEAGECGAAAAAVLARWAQEPRRSILRVVTLQADTDTPTALHRLLCRLAQCIVSNSESTVRAYEAACTAVLGSNTDVMSWGKSPHPKKLPRLAIRLYPNNEKYFKDELNMAPEDS